MGAHFLSGQLFRRDCCSPVRAGRGRRSCQCSEEALGVLRQRTGLPSSELSTVESRGKLKCGLHSSSRSRLHLRFAHRRKREATGLHRADPGRPPAKGALKHRHSVRRGNSRYATPFPASLFRRMKRRGSATVEAMNPMQGQGCTMDWSGRRESNPRMQLGKTNLKGLGTRLTNL
jgi:hypothetical protein